MPNQSLVDLTERTATADSDLIHVNSGGTDYKETKANFTADLATNISFNNTSTLESQIQDLGNTSHVYTGYIEAYGHQTATGVPQNTNFFVTVYVKDASHKRVVIRRAISGNEAYTKYYGGSSVGWSDWVQEPSRAEITALNNSLATKQDNLEWKLVYHGSIAKSSSYTHTSNDSHIYLVVFGTWNFKGVYFVVPQNGGTPQVASIITASSCSFSASGTWGFTVNNTNSAFPMPVYIFQL